MKSEDSEGFLNPIRKRRSPTGGTSRLRGRSLGHATVQDSCAELQDFGNLEALNLQLNSHNDTMRDADRKHVENNSASDPKFIIGPIHEFNIESQDREQAGNNMIGTSKLHHGPSPGNYTNAIVALQMAPPNRSSDASLDRTTLRTLPPHTYSFAHTTPKHNRHGTDAYKS
ncbi:hypothetical protein KC19_VG153600 [Ceratodon purpureus]|uniref:Uncharacterized protein n=1 Tax=Ceratodon purpureus TaxID=3225 RepID=A0A8T0HQT9_CERPU|nr:hypothetical protein KC19_VG153600 [Ceratodon purpureus]